MTGLSLMTTRKPVPSRLSDKRLDGAMTLAKRLGHSLDLWIHLTGGLSPSAIAEMAQRAAAVLPERPRPDQPKLADMDITELPFVRDVTAEEAAAGRVGRVYWSPPADRGYLEGSLLGETYAKQALRYMASGSGASFLLPWIVRDMQADGGNLTGIETGFLSHFGGMAKAAQQLLDTYREEANVADSDL